MQLTHTKEKDITCTQFYSVNLSKRNIYFKTAYFNGWKICGKKINNSNNSVIRHRNDNIWNILFWGACQIKQKRWIRIFSNKRARDKNENWIRYNLISIERNYWNIKRSLWHRRILMTKKHILRFGVFLQQDQNMNIQIIIWTMC